MEIRVGAKNDSLCMAGDKIQAIVNSIEYDYELPSVNKIVLFTTDSGPVNDDMGLAIEVGINDVIFIMSEHKCFNSFLFDQVGKVLPIDFQKVIDASTCTDNGVFEIYVNKGQLGRK